VKCLCGGLAQVVPTLPRSTKEYSGRLCGRPRCGGMANTSRRDQSIYRGFRPLLPQRPKHSGSAGLDDTLGSASRGTCVGNSPVGRNDDSQVDAMPNWLRDGEHLKQLGAPSPKWPATAHRGLGMFNGKPCEGELHARLGRGRHVAASPHDRRTLPDAMWPSRRS